MKSRKDTTEAFKSFVEHACSWQSHVMFINELRFSRYPNKVFKEIEHFVDTHDCSLKDTMHCHGIFTIGNNPLYARCAFEICEAPNGAHTWSTVLFDKPSDIAAFKSC